MKVNSKWGDLHLPTDGLSLQAGTTKFTECISNVYSILKVVLELDWWHTRKKNEWKIKRQKSSEYVAHSEIVARTLQVYLRLARHNVDYLEPSVPFQSPAYKHLPQENEWLPYCRTISNALSHINILRHCHVRHSCRLGDKKLNAVNMAYPLRIQPKRLAQY